MYLNRTPVYALLASLIFTAGCSGSGKDSDTYLQFRIEDQHFEIDHVIFGVLSLPKDGWQFIEIGQDAAKINIVTAVPSASIQWRMKLEDLTALEGRVIDLDEVNHPDLAGPIALFELTDDISAFNSVGSTITVTVSKVSDGFVEGTFEGRGLSYVSGTKDAFKTVNTSGSYRARILR